MASRRPQVSPHGERHASPRDRGDEELRRSLEERAQFLTCVSSELRTPLSSILILAGLLSENSDGNLSARELGYARRIHRAATDALHLVDDVLDLSRIEADQLSLFTEAVEVGQLLEELEAQFRPRAQEKGLRLTLAIDEEVPHHLHTDRKRLRQVLTCLLVGALHSTEEGSIRLEVAVADPDTATRAGCTAGQAVALTVRDTGCGIPRERWETLFEPFAAPDPRTSREHGGVGLGLALAKGLTETLGGKLSLESGEGAGSCFTVFLPAGESPPHRRGDGL